MKTGTILLILSLTLLSNLSYSQTDSLLGKEVIVYLHKTKKTITAEYKSYKNNRVTVLFDNSLHDYFYPEVKLLQFEGFDIRFSEKGEAILEKQSAILTHNIAGVLNQDNSNSTIERFPKEATVSNKALIVTEIYGIRSFTIDLNKKVKVVLNNKTVLKSSQIEIVNDSTLKFYSDDYSHHYFVGLDEIYQIKGMKLQSEVITGIGYGMTALGVITTPWLIGIPILVASRYVQGHKSKNMYFWKLSIQDSI